MPFKPFIGYQFLVAIFWAIDMSLRPYLIKLMVDGIIASDPTQVLDNLFFPASLYIGVSFLMVVISGSSDLTWLILNSRLKKHTGTSLMSRLMQHSHHFYQNHLSGNLANKINDIINGIPLILTTCIDQFFSDSIAFCIAVYTAWQVSPCFALALIAWVLVFFVGSAPLFLTKAKKLADHAAHARSVVAGAIVDVISNNINVRIFGGKFFEESRLNKTFQDSLEAEQAKDTFFMKIYSFQGISFVIFQGICLWWLAHGIKNGTLSIGDFSLILTLNMAVLDCLWRVSEDICKFTEQFGNIHQGLKIINSPFEISDSIYAKTLEVKKARIVFDSVRFRYKGGEPLFKDVCLTIESGEKVGLVGSSGSGKTTFTNLIMRFLKVRAGKILIDGQDISMVTQESLRKAISVVPQDPILFHRTVMENILYSRLDATYDEVIEATKRAHAYEFITKLPEGFNTLVGERGARFSGGQRQRIALARAFLKNSPILICDEATSQLDSFSESLIQESLYHLMKGKTTFAIAHRLSTLLNMDRILVFHQGHIVEQGKHEELLEMNGFYTQLWNAQIGGLGHPTENRSDPKII